MKATLPGLLFLLSLLIPPVFAGTSEKCGTEIRELEAQITKEKKKPENQSERNQKYLAQADQWLAQARKHSAGGDFKGCVSSAQKGWATLIAL